MPQVKAFRAMFFEGTYLAKERNPGQRVRPGFRGTENTFVNDLAPLCPHSLRGQSG